MKLIAKDTDADFLLAVEKASVFEKDGEEKEVQNKQE